MALSHSPSIVTNGLVLCLDAANLKSFKGVNATNILNSIAYNQINQSSATYRVTNGEESVYIPSLGVVTSKYVDFYNDYGGSGVCCPNLYSYGTGLSVSPNTTYTYSIIYKTTSGYSHPNYMYRYEYASNGAYAGEAGVHSTSNRTSLGDGWWFAWGQFTTSATTATLNTFLFHYEYGTQNRVYVYRAALYQGTYIIPPEHMLNIGQVRGTTVATGGGWADLSGIGSNGELINGTTYSSSNGKGISFDGVNDYVDVTQNLGVLSEYTFCHWSRRDVEGRMPIGWRGGPTFYQYGDNSWFYTHGGVQGEYYYPKSVSIPTGTWGFYCITYDGTAVRIYRNSVLEGSQATSGTADWTNGVRIGFWSGGGGYYYQGAIANVSMYNRALTAAQVQQNFNALRGRYGI